jgi:anaerobic magnesium-protoporphyrin IX monomethyl ester cyclase
LQKPIVVLYNPRAVFYTMPLALLAVGSFLNQEKYDIVIIDGRLETDPIARIFSFLPMAICFGVTVLTGDPIKDALEVSRAVKGRFPDIPIVWGGWHPSLFPQETLAEKSIDIVVKGQGENSFAELLERLKTGQSLLGLQGICYKEKDSIVMNLDRHLSDINSFPSLNYDLINVRGYRKLSGKNQIDYISSQGCRFRCAFCADPAMYKRGWYGYAAERIGNEIESLWKKYRFEHVHFQDETFFTSKKRVQEVAGEFIRRELPITWFGTMRADQGVRLDEETWKLCKLSGLKKIMIGMEAGTQLMLDWMQKDIKLEHIFETAEKCVRHNIAIIFSVIVGFPNETAESVFETLSVVKKLRKMSDQFSVSIYYYKPYPGNKIADELSAGGYQFPAGLEEWSNFDYVNSGKSDWLTEAQVKRIELFKFYNELAWSKKKASKLIFQQIARWRCDHDQFAFPIEKKIIRFIKPAPKVS